MTAAVMIERIADTSPRFKARVAGAFYSLTGLILFAVIVRDRLVVIGDAAATAANILAHQSLFFSGIAADLIGLLCYVAVTALFYVLFRPVSKSVSAAAVVFSLIGCVIQAFASVFHVVPMLVLGRAQYMSVFTTDQLQPIALLLLRLHAAAFNLGLAFFGVYCLLIGYLVFRSTFLPRGLGVLVAVGGLAYLLVLSPSLAPVLFPYIIAAGSIGEGSLMLWLVLNGVNVQRWNEQAGGKSH